MARPRIACLAWGSLLWDPRTLPRSGDFHADGPELPIEFSRVSADGRVTLVIDSTAAAVRTWWVPLDVGSLDEAVAGLGIRERIAPASWPEHVGRLSRPGPESPSDSAVLRTIRDWLREMALDAVVWTALPPRRPDGEAALPDFADLLAHLESLRGAARARAEEYIRRAPGRLRTSHRRGFERALGWTSDARLDPVRRPICRSGLSMPLPAGTKACAGAKVDQREPT